MNRIPATASEKEMLARQHRMKVEEIRHECNAPRRHLEFSSCNLTGPWGGRLSILSAKLYTGFLVAIVGLNGNGKTQLGVELMKTVMEQEKSAHYLTAINFFSRLKATYRRDSDETELDVLHDLLQPSLLVIDEIGKRSDTKWENNQLFELINNRYANSVDGNTKDTLLIDNNSRDTFLASMEPSISSRMQETGGVVVAGWPSFRI